MKKIILASSSNYRKILLSKLGIDFICAAPLLNEDELKTKLIQKGKTPLEVAEQLSFEKGFSVFNQIEETKIGSEQILVISGDQLVSFENQIMGKPLTTENAIKQLNLLNNKTHELITSVTLLTSQDVVKFNHKTQLKMKNLTQNEIAHYIEQDLPLDCSGSYKIELSGIALFESINCDDFTAIQGIPMIWLSNRLKEMNYEFFKN